MPLPTGTNRKEADGQPFLAVRLFFSRGASGIPGP